ncbi:LysR family transcriptional regulator [Burkholderia pyrrocinia]|uniref:LysR family transcriptional regulator n=1 Tax=Burkholderia sp. IT-111MI5 TaxID=3026439 RepID=UPI002A26A2F0|nr:LysR family transcriptional regulator [Burkholderia pyrrocinia]EKS9892322.1 LysR family transcriptional regulator [Burkholderia pyrrocinia]
MPRENLNDLLVFLAVARDRSFTRAAARLGVRLLTRTTRSVSTTEAGEELFQAVAPRIDEIEMKLAAVSDFRDKPAGVVRITATEHPIDTIVWPKLRKVLPDFPDIRVELSVDYGLSNIVEERYDIGVRYGDQVAKDMIAVRISPDIRMAMVASPAYLDGRKPPKTPQDLLDHDCVTLRLATAKGIYAWELKKGRNEIQARVNGRITCNTQPHMVQAALDGFGIAFVTEDIVLEHVRSGTLRIVMPDWCPVFPGYHAYYPSRRQASRAFSVVIDALRHRA